MSIENRFQARGKYRDRDGPFVTLRPNKHVGPEPCLRSKSFSSSPAVGVREVHLLHTAQRIPHPPRHRVRNTVYTDSAMGGVGKVGARYVSKSVTKDHFSL